jgi:hypothetical protein
MKKRMNTTSLFVVRCDRAVNAKVRSLTEEALLQVRGGGGPEGPDLDPPPITPDPNPPAASKPK